MKKLSKRMRAIQEKVDFNKTYSLDEAIELLQSVPRPKFESAVEVDCQLNIDPKKANVRGSVGLPHGTGRKIRVIVLTESKEQIEAALSEGAAFAGLEGLINDIKQGELNLNARDTLIATPAAMRLLVPLGSILGPKGLMPNPKLGTVTSDPVKAVRDALLGQVQYRNDKGGSVRCLVGRLSFNAEDLKVNLKTLLSHLIKNKPDTASKGRSFIKKVILSSSMGPGLRVDQGSLDFSTAL